MLPTREQVLAKADALSERPVAFEAFWDGDSSGWFVTLSAILRNGDGYRDSFLWAMQDGGDLRLFNAQVPPWGEARLAQTIGEELARKFGVPFFFASPDHPEDECPRWWEQHRAYPCRRCGILLLQRKDCPWPGVCYHCHLEEDREKKEAAQTPEERAKPRCRICGNPAHGELNSSPACADCLARFECSPCSRCGAMSLTLKTRDVPYVCSGCELREKLDAVAPEHREGIRIATARNGKLAGTRVAIELLGWTLRDAMEAVREFADRAAPNASADGDDDVGC